MVEQPMCVPVRGAVVNVSFMGNWSSTTRDRVPGDVDDGAARGRRARRLFGSRTDAPAFGRLPHGLRRRP